MASTSCETRLSNKAPVLCIVLLCAATVLASDAPDHTVFVFRGGNVITVDPRNPQVASLAIAGGRIIAVGDNDSVLKAAGEKVKSFGKDGFLQLIQLNGMTVMPGFVEPHTHMFETALANYLMTVNLSWFEDPPLNPPTIVTEIPGVKYSGTVITALKKGLDKVVPKGDKCESTGWLTAFGFDPARTKPFMTGLNKDILDSVSPTVPIFVLNQSGHIAYVNSRAIECARLEPGQKAPPGGTYVTEVRNGHEVYTGVLLEPPSYVIFQEAFPKPAGDSMLAALRRTADDFAKAGITTASELILGAALGSFEKELGLLATIETDPRVRIRAYYDAQSISSANPLPAKPPSEQKKDEEPDLLRAIGVKFITDGSTQGLTAALKADYDYPPPYPSIPRDGNLNYEPTKEDPDPLFARAKPLFTAGWQLSMHSNGDRALSQVLDVYGRLLAEVSVPAARRFRIEHLTVTQDAQLDRIKALGITPSMTIGHLYYWGCSFRGGACLGLLGEEAVKKNERILGKTRTERLDPAGSLRRRDIRFSFHSDSPITPAKPLLYISTAVSRRMQFPKNDVLSPCPTPGCPQWEGISVDEAIRAVTLDAAYQLFLDGQVGSLERDKWADLLILEKNPRDMSTTPENIKNIKVIATYLSGKCVSGQCPTPRPLPAAAKE